MSTTTQDDQAFLVRLRRDLEEANKLAAEREKLMQEALKLQRDRSLAPLIAIGGLGVGALGVIVGILGVLLRH